MSRRLVRLVWSLASVSNPSALLLLLALAEQAGEDGIVETTIPELAAKLRVSERRTSEVVRKAEEGRWITVSRGSGRGNGSTFTLTVGAPPKPATLFPVPEPEPEPEKERAWTPVGYAVDFANANGFVLTARDASRIGREAKLLLKAGCAQCDLEAGVRRLLERGATPSLLERMVGDVQRETRVVGRSNGGEW